MARNYKALQARQVAERGDGVGWSRTDMVRSCRLGESLPDKEDRAGCGGTTQAGYVSLW